METLTSLLISQSLQNIMCVCVCNAWTAEGSATFNHTCTHQENIQTSTVINPGLTPRGIRTHDLHMHLDYGWWLWSLSQFGMFSMADSHSVSESLYHLFRCVVYSAVWNTHTRTLFHLVSSFITTCVITVIMMIWILKGVCSDLISRCSLFIFSLISFIMRFQVNMMSKNRHFPESSAMKPQSITDAGGINSPRRFWFIQFHLFFWFFRHEHSYPDDEIRHVLRCDYWRHTSFVFLRAAAAFFY